MIDTYYRIQDITFLKRRFSWDAHLKLYLPQLDYGVIYEIARWSESDPYNMVDQLNRFNSSLLELSNYGRDEYQKLRSKYVEYINLLRKDGFVIYSSELFSYDYCEKIKFGLDDADFSVVKSLSQ